MLIPVVIFVFGGFLLDTNAHLLPNLRFCNPFIRCNRFCPAIYLPVCGSNRVTYDNTCYLSLAECQRGDVGSPITKAYNGKCRDRQVDPNCNDDMGCIEIYAPICGSDNKTYSNECYLNRANCQRPKNLPPITQAYRGECNADCNIACTKIYAPVCGSDGKNYSNECVLSVANFKRGNIESPITVAYKGECRSRNCPDVCITLYDPVCGSDGKNYSNSCFLGIANCKRGPNEAPITEAYKGECQKVPEICPRFCTLQYDPVCGSDGNTYSNSCFLGIANCNSLRNGGAPITEASGFACGTLS